MCSGDQGVKLRYHASYLKSGSFRRNKTNHPANKANDLFCQQTAMQMHAVYNM